MFRKKDGTEFPVEINAAVVRDEAGQPLYIQSIIRDITERRQIEEDLKKQQEFLRHIIDYNPNVVIVKDYEGRFVLANRTAEKEYGISIEEMLGKTDRELGPVREEVEAFMQDDQKAMETLQVIYNPEEPSTYADGELHWHQDGQDSLCDIRWAALCHDCCVRYHRPQAHTGAAP